MKTLERFSTAGSVYYCGDFVNTDVMAPGRFDPIYEKSKLAKIALIDYEGQEPFVDPKLERSRFSIIVAGRDFGCGSSRETAPMAIAAAGVNVIIAKSFARIFFRNCINMGEILPIQIDHDFDVGVHGVEGLIDPIDRTIKIQGQTIDWPSFGVLNGIIDAGGLSSFVQAGGFQ